MSRRAWARKMRRSALVQLPIGLALLMVGSLVATTGGQPMTGYMVGSVGVLLLVVGALCYKFSIAGPYPKHLEDDL